MNRNYRYLFLVAILVILSTIIFFDPIRKSFELLASYFYPNSNDGKAEFLKILLSILGAAGILWGINISLRRAKALEKGVLNQFDQIELTRKSQIDERFKNAVEHLGSEKEPIILGGIAELYQIAKENSANYAEIVFKILCSYVRSERSRKKTDVLKTPTQTIFDYLFNNIDEESSPFNGLFADLQGANLEGIKIENANLRNANLSRCVFPQLSKVDLSEANLDWSIFKVYSLKDCNFQGVSLAFSQFRLNTIENCDFSDIKRFSSNDFLYCTIKNCLFRNTSFYNNNILSSRIEKWDLNGAEFISGSFALSHIEGLNFGETSLLGGIDFRASSFHSTKFSLLNAECDYTGATLEKREGHTLYNKRIEQILNKPIDVSLQKQIHGLYNGRMDIFTEADKLNLVTTVEQIKETEE